MLAMKRNSENHIVICQEDRVLARIHVDLASGVRLDNPTGKTPFLIAIAADSDVKIYRNEIEPEGMKDATQ